MPACRAVVTTAGKQQAVEVPSIVDSDLGDASDASDADDASFISDDGDDWRAQMERQTDRHVGVDLHRARIDAGLDPGAGADDEAEDDVELVDAPAPRSRFVDNEAGEAADSE